MSEQIQNMFSEIAPRYDCLNHVLSFQFDKRWRRQGARCLVGRQQVLDLCAGTLDFSIELAQQSPETKITAIDFSQAMLEHGRRKLSVDQADRIETLCADALSLPFEDKQFDGAMVAYGMRNVSNNEQTLNELRRVLKSGSLFVTLEFFRPDRWWQRAFDKTYNHTVVPLVGALLSGHTSAYRYLRDSIRNYYSVAEYVDLMKRCGFREVQCKRQFGPSSMITGVVA